MADIEHFYDKLAPYYPLLYADWERSMAEQAQALDAVIGDYFGKRPKRILDAACGIGTQAIGLAGLGYAVTGADISGRALGRAAANAAQRGLQLDLVQSDMRTTGWLFPGQFDLVIACDNAIPHLLSDADIQLAFESFFAATGAEGGALVSVRDYAGISRQGTQINLRRVQSNAERKVILLDTWDFDGEQYDLTIYLVEDDLHGRPHTAAIRGGRYYCVEIDRLADLLRQAGFSEVKILREAYFQPLLVALK